MSKETKKRQYERRMRQMAVDEENFFPQREAMFPIFELRQKWEEFEEMNEGRTATPYEFFIFLLKQPKP